MAQGMTDNVPTTEEEVRRSLAGLREKRGYLLPHHGLLAVAEPGLLEAYDATYTALTLTPRVLSERQKEIVWLIILVSTGEAIATHHIDRLRKGGGTDEDLNAAIAFAAWAEGAPHFNFVKAHWGPHLPNYDPIREYRKGIDALLAVHPVDVAAVELGLAAAHQCHRRWDWVREHIRGAYRESVDERAIAEALSLAMFPGGVPNFVDACVHWRDLIEAGEVAASPPFKAWASMTGQGGFDEAVGL
jgi:alkylhydroperoxidase/carboxymuconolactone decarboxylase family protein YurZ